MMEVMLQWLIPWRNDGSDDLPRSVAIFAASAVTGFVLMTRRSTTGERLAIAIAYFPVMFAILFVEAVYLAGLWYHEYL